MDKRSKRILLVLLGAAHSLNHSLFIALSIFLRTITLEFGTSFEIIGLIAGASYFIYGAGGIFGGRLSDRFGEVKTLTAGLALSGASTLIFLVANNLTMFTLGLLLMATFTSVYHAIANSFISKVFQTSMAEAMGIHGTGGNIGYMFAPTIAFALGTMWGWRISFLFFGILSIMISIFVFKWSPLFVKEAHTEAKILDIAGIPKLWTLITFNIAIGLFYKGVDTFFPTFLEERGFAEFRGLAFSSLLGIGILGQWISGKASDIWSSKKVLVATSAGTVLGLLCLPAVPQPVAGVLTFILVYGFSFYGHQPAFNSLAGLITPNNLRAMVFGILFFFSFGLGAISTPIAGVFASRYGLESAFYVMALFSFAAFLLSFLLPTKLNRLNRQEN